MPYDVMASSTACWLLKTRVLAIGICPLGTRMSIGHLLVQRIQWRNGMSNWTFRSGLHGGEI